MFVVILVLIAVINAALIVAVLRFRERRGREPLQVVAGRGALRPLVGGLAVLALAVFVFGIVRDQRRPHDRAGGAERARLPRRRHRSGSRACRRSRSPRRRSRRAARSRSAARSRPRRARCRSTRSPSSGCGASSIPAGRPGTARSPTVSSWSRSTPRSILDITSTDVLHSWWVPALGGQVQATPGDVDADLVQGGRGRHATRATRRSSPAPASRRCGPGSGWSRCPSTPPTSSSSRRT